MGSLRHLLSSFPGMGRVVIVFFACAFSAAVLPMLGAKIVLQTAVGRLSRSLDDALGADASALRMSFQYYDTASLQLLVNPDIQEILSSQSRDGRDAAQKTQRIHSIASSLFCNAEARHVASVMINSPNLTFPYHYLGHAGRFAEYANRYYPRIKQAAGSLVVIDDETFEISTGMTTVHDTFAMARLVRDALFREIGYIVLFADFSLFKEHFADLMENGEASFLVISQTGAVLFSRGMDAAAIASALHDGIQGGAGRGGNGERQGDAPRFLFADGRPLLMVRASMAHPAWTFACAIPLPKLCGALSVETATVLLMACTCLLVFFCLVRSAEAMLRLLGPRSFLPDGKAAELSLFPIGDAAHCAPYVCLVVRPYRQTGGRVESWEGPMEQEPRVGERISRIAFSCCGAQATSLPGGKFAIITGLPPAGNGDAASALASDLALRLDESLRASFGLGVHVGMSASHASRGELDAAYREACGALEMSFYRSGEALFSFDANAARNTADGGAAPNREIVNVLMLNDPSQLLEAWRAAALRMERHRLPPSLLKQYTVAFIERVRILLEEELGPGAANPPSRDRSLPLPILAASRLEDLEAALAAALQEVSLRLRGAAGNRDVIHRVKEYVKIHYGERLSLKLISRTFFINANYFCRLFKEKTGKSFCQYLAEVRIRKAIELMRRSALSTEQISEEVGYQSPNYFVRVFKKMTGSTVSDFKRKTLGITGKTFVLCDEPPVPVDVAPVGLAAGAEV